MGILFVIGYIQEEHTLFHITIPQCTELSTFRAVYVPSITKKTKRLKKTEKVLSSVHQSSMKKSSKVAIVAEAKDKSFAQE